MFLDESTSFDVSGALSFGVITRRVVDPDVDHALMAYVDGTPQYAMHGIVAY